MNLPSWLTAEQKADIQQSLRATELRKQGLYHMGQDLKHYGSPKVDPVPTTPAPYNFVDSREMRASVNHLERRIYNLERKNNGLRTNGSRA